MIYYVDEIYDTNFCHLQRKNLFVLQNPEHDNSLSSKATDPVMMSLYQKHDIFLAF